MLIHFISLALLASPLWAETTTDNKLLDLSLEELLQVKITSASLFEETLWEAPATVEVIDKAKKRRLGARSAADLYSQIEGTQSYTILYAAESMAIRGFAVGGASTGLGLLVDDVPMIPFLSQNSLNLPQYMFLPFIEKAELVKGPGSTLYGGDAFFGVQNWQTVGVQNTHWELSGDLGSRNYKSATLLSPGLSLGKLKFFLGYSYTDQGDQKRPYEYHDMTTKALKEASRKFAYEQHNLKLEASFKPSFNDEVKYSFYYGTRNTEEYPGYGRAFTPTTSLLGAYDKSNLEDLDSYHHRLSYKKEFSDALTTDLVAFHTSMAPRNRAYFGTVNTIREEEFTEREWGGKATLKFSSPSSKTRLAGGLDFKENNIIKGKTRNLNKTTGLWGTSSALPANNSKQIAKGVFLQGKQGLVYEELNLHLGARLDDYSNVGNHLSPRVALVWDEKDPFGKTLKLSYANSYRPPSSYDLNGTITAVKGINLKSETFDSFELVYGKKLGNYSLYSTLFYSELHDHIIPFSTGATNIGRSQGHGVELKGLHKSKFLEASLAGSYTESRNTTQHYAYEAFPKWIFTSSIDYKLPWETTVVGLDARYTREQSAAVASYLRTSGLSPYFNVNLNISHKIQDYTLWLRARNLFDRMNMLSSPVGTEFGTTAERRSFALGLDYLL